MKNKTIKDIINFFDSKLIYTPGSVGYSACYIVIYHNTNLSDEISIFLDYDDAVDYFQGLRKLHPNDRLSNFTFLCIDYADHTVPMLSFFDFKEEK